MIRTNRTGKAAAALVLAFAAVLAPWAASSATVVLQPGDDVAAAVQAAPDGTVLQLAAGAYGPLSLPKPGANAPAKSVTIVSADPANPGTFDQTSDLTPGVTFRDVTFTRNVFIYGAGTTLDGVTVLGSDQAGTVFARGNGATIENSTLGGGFAHDGIDVAGNVAGTGQVHGVIVANNVISHIGDDTGPNQAHPDCVQVYDADQVTITGNSLFDCSNSALTFSPGSRNGITNVLVQSNFMQGCTSAVCGTGGSSMDLRVGSVVGGKPITVSGVVVAHNTFASGSLRLPYQAGVTAPANIAAYLSISAPCTTSLTGSMVGGYSTALCKGGLPGASSGNYLAAPTYANVAANDLHLVGSVPQPDGTSVRLGAPDFDGQPFYSGVSVGADQP